MSKKAASAVQSAPQANGAKVGRLQAVDLLAQVRAMHTEPAPASPTVSQRNTLQGLRAYFSPITGDRRTGLVALHAIQTRPQGQVRSGNPVSHPDFADLVASIRTHGVLQPVTLSWDEAADCFWIDYGHRRVAAARAAGLEKIPAVIVMPQAPGASLDDVVMTEKQLIENLQRTQLPAIDVAHALRRLVSAGMSLSAVARDIGKSKSWVSKHLKFLELPKAVLTRAESSGIGHEVLYSLAQADIPAGELDRLLAVAIDAGRPALMRELETLNVVKGRKKSGAGHSGEAHAESTVDNRSSQRTILSASRRLLAAARHVCTLLEADQQEDAAELKQSLSNTIAALERYCSR